MKKIVAFILVSALVLSLGMTAASAKTVTRTHGANFVDANRDGVCDNCPYGGVRPQDGTGRRAAVYCGCS